jgi:hypothetical protein
MTTIGNSINCNTACGNTTTTTTTTTAAPTTTTTTAGPLNTYYEIQLCSGGSTYIMNATDVTPVVGGVYKVYAPTFLGTMNGINCWVVLSTTSTGLDDDATFGSNYGDCETCTPTTTTTTAAPGYYYYINQIQFNCGGGVGNCTGNEGPAYVGYSSVALVVGDYYNVFGGQVWVISGYVGGPAYDYDITSWAGGNYASCSDACQC